MTHCDEAAFAMSADGQAHLRQLRHWRRVSSWFWAQLPALLLLLLVVWGTPLRAQNDFSTVALPQPVSGCSLTATESVTVRLFNYGNTLPAATSVNISYRVNFGNPVTELVTLGTSLFRNSMLNYTFITTANLSAPGVYTIDADVSLAGDVNPLNNGLVGNQVRNSAPAIGGTTSGPGSGNSGVVTLTGQTGAVEQWEESADGARWFKLANTTLSQSFSGLTGATHFRAQVINPPCAPAMSSVTTVTP